MCTGKYIAKFQIASFILVSSILACRPVIAIGWGELLILVTMVVVLIGPPVYRLLDKYRRREK